MSISNEALQKLVQEIENQAIQSQQQIGIIRSQIAIKQREIRKLELTAKEVSELPSDTNMYEGVGKMFVFSPTSEVNSRLTTETRTLSSEVENLGKRLQYLETTFKNSREHMDQIFKSGGRA
ncbi:Prefoldin [Cadophora sp. MPI-SDFR-AT-0126]|nr:Prefoldin [Leotiomycetes sp. MPI-SDFR-AT-0126]